MLVGEPAPEFRLNTTRDLVTRDREATLADFRGRWLVLFFYPAGSGYGDQDEIVAFNAAVRTFNRYDARLLGVGTGAVHGQRIGPLDFPVAEDRSAALSTAYGVAEETRALYLIDPDGVVRYEVSHDTQVSHSVDEVLRVLQELRNGGHPVTLRTRPGGLVNVDRINPAESPTKPAGSPTKPTGSPTKPTGSPATADETRAERLSTVDR
jgi:peroxiredoxin (alkyl hydroperoxide reductase subunit C)